MTSFRLQSNAPFEVTNSLAGVPVAGDIVEDGQTLFYDGYSFVAGDTIPVEPAPTTVDVTSDWIFADGIIIGDSTQTLTQLQFGRTPIPDNIPARDYANVPLVTFPEGAFETVPQIQLQILSSHNTGPARDTGIVASVESVTTTGFTSSLFNSNFSTASTPNSFLSWLATSAT